jgi:hypothetical protein
MARKFRWLKFGLAVFALAVLAAMSSVAEADLILVNGTTHNPATSVADSFTDIGAQGFGNAPRMLTLQDNTVETGNETPIDVEHGGAIDGANKSTTPTLSALGWNTGANVGIGFNSDQSGQTGITMQSLVLTIFNSNSPTFTPLGSFSLAASLTPLTFTAADLALQQGNGNAVFNFGLNAAQQAQFNAILAMPGSSGFRAGLSSQLGCPAGAPAGCLVSNDGPDTFIGFRQNIPEPPTIVFLGFGLLALGYVHNRKVRA